MNGFPPFFSCLECNVQVQGPTSGLGIVSRVLVVGVQHCAVQCVPLRMARSGAMALWCQTVMSRVQGNTINTMARISLLFGISRIGYLARHYLGTKRDEDKLVSNGQKSRKLHKPLWRRTNRLRQRWRVCLDFLRSDGWMQVCTMHCGSLLFPVVNPQGLIRLQQRPKNYLDQKIGVLNITIV